MGQYADGGIGDGDRGRAKQPHLDTHHVGGDE